MTYRVFNRTWWRENPSYPDGLEPCAGKKRNISTAETIEEARSMCRAWNEKHPPGRLSRKAEFEEA